MKRSILAGLAVLCLLALPVRAQEAAAASTKEEDIRRLLVLMGSADLGKQVVEQMFAEFKKAAPNVPEEFWDGMLDELDPQGFVEMTVPIYDRHFTQDDIRQLIAFYETPVGRKLTAKLPAITQEAMAAGQKWGEEIAQRVVTRLQAQEQKKDQR